MWIGLLWYLNFVQIPSMPKLTDEQKPAITKSNSPSGSFLVSMGSFINNNNWTYSCLFKWLCTSKLLVLGIGSGGGKSTAIGIGMWLGLIMAFNVWFIIWPNQKRVFVDAP